MLRVFSIQYGHLRNDNIEEEGRGSKRARKGQKKRKRKQFWRMK